MPLGQTGERTLSRGSQKNRSPAVGGCPGCRAGDRREQQVMKSDWSEVKFHRTLWVLSEETETVSLTLRWKAMGFK